MHSKHPLVSIRFSWFWIMVLGLVVFAGACSSGGGEKTLYIAGIPDQDISVLEARFDKLANYLSEETGLNVRYLPSVDYAAVVIGFRQGDIHLAWYGGLTGVQARLAAPGAQALAQREEDAAFHSVFIAQKSLGIKSLEDLKGRRVTFGSESSTSGNLMPRSFLAQVGIDPEDDFSAVNYSGSHDKTWKRVEDGSVDTSKVEAFYTTPPYFDYHWVASGGLDEEFGEGATERLLKALLALSSADGGLEQEIMAAFDSARFISTNNENYTDIEQVARDLGIIEN